MKKLCLLILAAALSTAADAPSVVEGPIVPWRIQVDLVFDSEGAVTSAKPKVYYQQTITVGGTALVKDHGVISWDSVAKAGDEIEITLANSSTATTTRGRVLQAIIAIAAQEKANPPVEEEVP
jgi:cytoskeletal protein RodZ